MLTVDETILWGGLLGSGIRIYGSGCQNLGKQVPPQDRVPYLVIITITIPDVVNTIKNKCIGCVLRSRILRGRFTGFLGSGHQNLGRNFLIKNAIHYIYPIIIWSYYY